MNTMTRSLLVVVASLALAAPAFASSHREAPAISLDPAADNTDVYAFMSPARDFVYLIANYIPLEEPAGGPNFHAFDPAVRYEIHIVRGPDSLDDVVVYRVEFTNDAIPEADEATETGLFNGIHFFRQLAETPPLQHYTVTRVVGNQRTLLTDTPGDVAPPDIGPRTDANVYEPVFDMPNDTYDDAFAATFIKALNNGGRAFAGPRDDEFFVDLGGVFDLAGVDATGDRATPTDGVSGFNVHTIALEIPTTELTFDGNAAAAGPSAANTIGVWASASRRKATIRRVRGDRHYGRFVQVSRLGLPLINEVVIGLQDKDEWNRRTPRDDLARYGAYFLNPVIARNAETVGIYGPGVLNLNAQEIADLQFGPNGAGRADVIAAINIVDFPNAGAHSGAEVINSIGDVLRVDLGTNSSFPNGRNLGEDVTDILASLLIAGDLSTISDGIDQNDKAPLAEFPFLPAPHEGFDEGHGVAP